MVRCSQPAPVLRGFLVAASLAVALWLPAGEAAQGSSGAHSPPNLVGWIVYSNAQGIWVMDADGSNHRQVTHPGTEHADYDPALSPDGSTIAFRSSRATPPDSIMLVDIDGTNERSLAVLAGPPTGYGMAQQGWSPDGSKLAFTCNCPQNTHSFGPHSGVYTANADGTGLTKLNEDGQYPDWSPDGTRVVYMADRDGNHELSIMNADGTGETNLTRHPASDNVPRWSPDGSTIVFFSDRDGNEEIYTIRPDGTGLTRITDTPAYEEFPIWSPDGRIAFNRGEPHDTETPPTWHLVHADGTGEVPLPQLDAVEAGFADWIAGAPTDRPSTPAPAGSEAATAVATPIDGFAGRIVYHDAAGDLWTMDTDGTGRIRLTDSGAGFDFDPRWSPDGTQVLFRTSRYPGAPNADGLMLVGADGTDERPLLPHGSFGDWSPDGRRIVATAGDQGLVILKPDGTGVTPLGATGECARWSPDGTRIAYCHLEDNPSGTPQWEVYVVNADGSNQTRLTHRPAYDYPSGWSPDGRQLVVWAQLGAPERLALLDPDTGEEQPLTGLASSHEVLGAWLTDGRFLVGIESPADGLHGWYLLDRSDPAHPRFTPVLPALQTICCGEGQLAWMPSPR